jgi:hypothetical protein
LDSNISYRWRDESEFDCDSGSWGCWSVEVRPDRICERGLLVRGVVKDQDETVIGDFSVRRTAQVGAGKRVSVLVTTDDEDASLATVTSIECLRAPAPTPRPTPRPTRRPAVSRNCTPGYSPCIPPASDVDCAGGSGNGPEYTRPGVSYRVTGSDLYGLDADGDGIGCE